MFYAAYFLKPYLFPYFLNNGFSKVPISLHWKLNCNDSYGMVNKIADRKTRLFSIIISQVLLPNRASCFALVSHNRVCSAAFCVKSSNCNYKEVQR